MADQPNPAKESDDGQAKHTKRRPPSERGDAMSRPAAPVKFLTHLSFVGARPAADGCFVCRHVFEDEPFSPPGCQRCGLEPLYHFHCYVDGIALEEAEAAFWAAAEDVPCHTLFLCPGCRS
jgi:hypothetical protein